MQAAGTYYQQLELLHLIRKPQKQYYQYLDFLHLFLEWYMQVILPNAMLPRWRTTRNALLRTRLFSLEKAKHKHRLSLLLPVFILFTFIFFSFKGNQESLFSQLQQERISKVILEPQFHHYLSACVIVRESSDIIVEFLIRNFAAGVDHFFIYGDDDKNREIQRLKTVFAAVDGLVTYIQFGRKAPKDAEDQDNYVQMRMYRHCLQTFGNTSKWVALIDSDEFFETPSLPFPNVDRNTLARRAFLHDILSTHEMFPVLCVRWKTSLTNGRLLPLSKGQTLHDLFPRTCTVRVNSTEKLALRKTILQPRFLDLDRTPKLDVAIHKGFLFTGRQKRFHCKWGLGNAIVPPIYIIHYWSRDLFSYLKKIRRGRPRKSIPQRNLADLFSRETFCDLDDETGSQDIRNPFLKRFIGTMPFFPAFSDEPASVEEAIGDLNSDFAFCERRVSKLIMKLGRGKDFSDRNYCKNRISPACELVTGREHREWPFPWSEYITNCKEDIEEDSFFL